jgi:hypothetical protein
MENRIRATRVVGAGLVAGLIINVGEFLAHRLVLHEEVIRAVERFGLTPPGPGAAGLLLFNMLLAGIVMVWLYATIRQRTASTFKAAVIAGAVFFFFSAYLPAAFLALVGFYSAKYVAIGLPWALMQSVLAAYCGGSLYSRHTA